MAEYIKREDAIITAHQLVPHDAIVLGWLIAVLNDTHTAADVAEVRHGRWVSEENESVSKRNRLIKYEVYSCSICGRSNGRMRKKYCPSCGARMDEEET